jgi:hypothetical protein
LRRRDRAPAECTGRNLILACLIPAHSPRYCPLLVMAICLTATCFLFSSAQSNVPNEYQVKAAFLYNFSKFVEWPPDAFQNEKTPITLCIFGDDPFGSVLDEIVRGKVINNRLLSIRRTNALPGLKACQLVFVSGREDKRLSEMFNSLKGSSALVVGESEDFAERGGGIQFFLEENKMRFSINVDAVQRARLKVSSKLLALARIVRDEGHPKGG